MTPADREKRQEQRFPSDLRLRCGRESDTVLLEAVNLSISGAYGSTDSRFDPMTRLQVQFDLPGSGPGSTPIEATAIVVRVEDGENPPFRTALWFQEISRPDRARLRRHLGIEGH